MKYYSVLNRGNNQESRHLRLSTDLRGNIAYLGGFGVHWQTTFTLTIYMIIAEKHETRSSK